MPMWPSFIVSGPICVFKQSMHAGNEAANKPYEKHSYHKTLKSNVCVCSCPSKRQLFFNPRHVLECPCGIVSSFQDRFAFSYSPCTRAMKQQTKPMKNMPLSKHTTKHSSPMSASAVVHRRDSCFLIRGMS